MLTNERAVERARAAVRSFRPLRPPRAPEEPRVLVSGFGPFPAVPRNATAEMIRSLGVELRASRVRDLEIGRGRVRLPSGRVVLVSAMVLPVVWDAAAMLVAKEARALRPAVILMSGVAAPAQPLIVERAASCARLPIADAWGVRHARRVRFAPPRALPLRFDLAEQVARRAIEREVSAVPSLGEVLQGVQAGAAREDNAYVCNATAHGVVTLLARSTTMLRSRRAPGGLATPSARLGSVDCGFLHWPRDLSPDHARSTARILLEMVDALVLGSRSEPA